MANSRLDLYWEFVDLLGTREELTDKRVYFQPPTNVKLSYPCIVYKRDAQDETHANNLLYQMKKRYLVTIIDKNPDSIYPDKMMKFPYCSFVNHYVADNLNHDVYSLYY